MMPQTRHGPDALERTEAANHKHRIQNNSALAGYRALAGNSRPAVRTNPIDLLLPLLQNVRQHGEAWRADCPRGHSHARGSLRIATGDDGRVLLHCFVGCDASEVATAAGVRLADLFPKPVTRMTDAERRNARMRAREGDWGAALGVLAVEATVVELAATTIARGDALGADDIDRVRTASRRIHDCREVLR